MTAEWISAFAAVGTLVVIAATAFAALVQLRHIRSANQLSGLLHFTSVFESNEIQHANVFIARELEQKMQNSEFINGLLEANTDRREHPELRVCDFLEQQGSYIKFGMIEKGQYIDLVGAYVRSMWDALQVVVALRRVARNSGAMYENFEYLASLAAADATKPQAFPRGVAILMDEQRWRQLAEQTIAKARREA